MAAHGGGIDPGRPSPARVADYLAGGKDNYEADRAEAARIEAAYPPAGGLPAPRRMARTNLEFTARAVSWAAGRGVAQFAQFAAGLLPPRPYQAVHQVAREVIPGARVAYVDEDPVVLSHVRALAGGAAAVEGSAASVGEVLASGEFAGAIDVTRPWCAIWAMALHVLPGITARDAVAACVAVMPPGSCLVITVPRCDDDGLWDRVRGASAAAGWARNYAPRDFAALFTGTVIAEPGLVPARAWRPVRPACLEAPGPVYVMCGVGIKGA